MCTILTGIRHREEMGFMGTTLVRTSCAFWTVFSRIAWIAAAITGKPAFANALITGVMLSDQGGVSADAVGMLRLEANGRVYSFDYALKSSGSNVGCMIVGAILEVEAVDVRSRSGTATRIRCTGGRVTRLYEAQATVRAYLQAYLDHNSELARSFLPATGRREIDTLNRARLDDVSEESLRSVVRRPSCLEAAPSSRNDGATKLSISVDCHPQYMGNPARIDFRLDSRVPSRPRIAEISIVQ